MREYLLLLLIAFIGLSGLISIHRDVKMKAKPDIVMFRQGPKQQGPEPQSASVICPNRLIIEQGESWSLVNFEIQNYSEGEVFQLDLGNGSRLPISKSHVIIEYERPGNYFVKLFKDNQLLEASEIVLIRPQIIL